MTCPYCKKAKELLSSLGVNYKLVEVDERNQVKAFDAALGLTGLIVTKLDGTAKGGVLAAIAREKPIPVYFIGVGEKLEDLETFSAREFAQALLG